jgi:hypothetical protein
MPGSQNYGRTQAFKNFNKKKMPGIVLNCKKRSVTTCNRLSYTPDIALWPFTALTVVMKAQAVKLFKDLEEVM